jgi:hypothetical protein
VPGGDITYHVCTDHAVEYLKQNPEARLVPIPVSEPEPKDKILRVIRVLEYEGPEKWIRKTMDKSYTHGKSALHFNGSHITELSYSEQEVG